MSQEPQQPSPAPAPAPPSQPDHSLPPPPAFDPSRKDIYVYTVIGIIKRKALIKELAAVYHAECLAYCQELLELQKKWDEPFINVKSSDDLRKEKMKPPKRLKKSR
ncbi:hypothetical protein REPUB_Repub13aG0212300 [Reevesia pubescens]